VQADECRDEQQNLLPEEAFVRQVSRRDFLKYAGAGALGMFVPRVFGLRTGPRTMVSDASDVVQCYNQDAVRSNVIYPEIVQSMMDESVMALTGIPQVGEAWKSLFPGIATDSVIGIKVNCINYRLSTHPEVTNAIVEGLARMQVGGSPFLRNNVIIWDRGSSELTNAGYTIYTGSDPDTVRCYGVDGNWDVGNPLNVNGVTSNPAPQLSQSCDYLINAACLKDHSTARMTLTLKNHYGTVHNPGSLHGNHCNPYLPSLSAQIRDVLGDKQKLYITDGLFGIYTGGPGGSPQFVPELLLMSRDTVEVRRAHYDRGRAALRPGHDRDQPDRVEQRRPGREPGGADAGGAAGHARSLPQRYNGFVLAGRRRAGTVGTGERRGPDRGDGV
jgi:uncharacterized protein (DUF362 family)